MKFTVLYGKRVARLELPPTVTLTELSEGLAERFNLQDPTALKFRLQEGQPSVPVRDYPDATLESAGAEGWRTGGCTSVGIVLRWGMAREGWHMRNLCIAVTLQRPFFWAAVSGKAGVSAGPTDAGTQHPPPICMAAGFTSGCKVRMSVSKHGAAADGGQQDSPHAAQQQQDQQQQQQQAEAPATAGDAKFVKGQPVLYRTREGTWQEAKVSFKGCSGQNRTRASAYFAEQLCCCLKACPAEHF